MSASVPIPASASPPGGTPAAASHKRGVRRRAVGIVAAVVALAAALYFGIPFVQRVLNTVSTDDAYVNGHVTFVAARIPDQVVNVLVDDNNRVKAGDLLVQLDKEPYQVQVNIAQAAVDAAQADLAAAEAQARGI